MPEGIPCPARLTSKQTKTLHSKCGVHKLVGSIPPHLCTLFRGYCGCNARMAVYRSALYQGLAVNLLRKMDRTLRTNNMRKTINTIFSYHSTTHIGKLQNTRLKPMIMPTVSPSKEGKVEKQLQKRNVNIKSKARNVLLRCYSYNTNKYQQSYRVYNPSSD
jgi:hypothetical protein